METSLATRRSVFIRGLSMSAEIIQFVPRPNPNREQHATEIAMVKLMSEPVEDTAPCEYSAPDNDPA